MNQSKTLIAVLVLLLILSGGFYLWKMKTTKQAVLPVSEDTPVDTSDWKTYRNEKIGIQFDYPGSWGEIKVSEEIGCIDYYAEKVIMPETVNDTCLHITLSASNFDSGAFMSTEGVDFTKTDMPRGVDWKFRINLLEKSKEDFCSNNPYLPLGILNDCMVFMTAKNVSVTRGIRNIPFTENEKMIVYFVRSPHAVFYDMVLSDANLRNFNGFGSEEDLRKLIETIQFLN